MFCLVEYQLPQIHYYSFVLHIVWLLQVGVFYLYVLSHVFINKAFETFKIVVNKSHDSAAIHKFKNSINNFFLHQQEIFYLFEGNDCEMWMYFIGLHSSLGKRSFVWINELIN